MKSIIILAQKSMLPNAVQLNVESQSKSQDIILIAINSNSCTSSLFYYIKHLVAPEAWENINKSGGWKRYQPKVVTRIRPIHQKLTRTSRGFHQSCAVGLTSRAVILKESRGQNPNITHTLVNLQTMTTFNTDLLDQQLNFSTLQDDEVQEVYGG